jgi:Family of unknown function (DUF5681)
VFQYWRTKLEEACVGCFAPQSNPCPPARGFVTLAGFTCFYCLPGESPATRFRPKEAKNKLTAIDEERMKSILIEDAYRAIKVRDGSREVTIPMIRAVVRSMALTAVKGHARSQLSTAETKCAKWRRDIVPVGLRERGFEAPVYDCVFVST